MSHRLVAFHSNVNGHAYSYPLPTLCLQGLNLDLNDIERIVIHLSVFENDDFNTVISEYDRLVGLVVSMSDY